MSAEAQKQVEQQQPIMITTMDISTEVVLWSLIEKDLRLFTEFTIEKLWIIFFIKRKGMV